MGNILVLTGGPSEERGVSLATARCVAQYLHVHCAHRVRVLHLSSRCVQTCELLCASNDASLHPTAPIRLGCLSSNTSEDFEPWIAQSLWRPLDAAVKAYQPVSVLVCAHGQLAEGGAVLNALHQLGVYYWPRTRAHAAATAFNKRTAKHMLASKGFATLRDAQGTFESVQAAGLLDVPVVCKPTNSGSSVDVTLHRSGADALSCLQSAATDAYMLEEIAPEGSVEVSVVLLASPLCRRLTPLVPTSVHVKSALSQQLSNCQTSHSALFSYQRKYLPTGDVQLHTPPAALHAETLTRLCQITCSAANTLSLSDVARVDAFVLPQSADAFNENIVLTDVNVVPGLDNTSMLFAQAAASGLSHEATLRTLFQQHLPPWKPTEHKRQSENQESDQTLVYVICGGNASERQVSLRSGTNVWLTLRSCKNIHAVPFVLTPNCSESCTLGQRRVVRPPYELMLRHTVEEIDAASTWINTNADWARDRRDFLRSQQDEHWPLDLVEGLDLDTCTTLSLDDFASDAAHNCATVFVAIHGECGENGELQSFFDEKQCIYTGSSATVAACTADKASTGQQIASAQLEGVRSLKKVAYSLRELQLARVSVEILRQELQTSEDSALCIKPRSEGCSFGVCQVSSDCELMEHVHMLQQQSDLSSQDVLIEEYIGTNSEWIECTVGVYGNYKALIALPLSASPPEGDVLSFEEKFQAGSGINLTPPPDSWIPKHVQKIAQQRIVDAANALGLHGLARLDAFVHAHSGEVIIIEANSVPGMTPSTVLFHQAYAADLTPADLLRTAVYLPQRPQ